MRPLFEEVCVMKTVITKVEIVEKDGKEDYQVWEKDNSMFSKWRLEEERFKTKGEAIAYAESPGYGDNVVVKYEGEYRKGVKVAKNDNKTQLESYEPTVKVPTVIKERTFVDNSINNNNLIVEHRFFSKKGAKEKAVTYTSEGLVIRKSKSQSDFLGDNDKSGKEESNPQNKL